MVFKKFPRIKFFSKEASNGTANTTTTAAATTEANAQRMSEESEIPTVSVQIDDDLTSQLNRTTSVNNLPHTTGSFFNHGQRLFNISKKQRVVVACAGIVVSIITSILLMWLIIFALRLIFYELDTQSDITNSAYSKKAEIKHYNLSYAIKSNVKAEILTTYSHAPNNFKSELCAAFLQDLKTDCRHIELKQCPTGFLASGITNLLNSIVNRTSGFYNFSWIENVIKIQNLIVKTDKDTLLLEFETHLTLRFSSRDNLNHLTFNDFRTRVEVLFSFCDQWFNNFNLIDANKVLS